MELELDSEDVLDNVVKEKPTLLLPADIRLYTPLQRLMDRLFGCRHVWSFPFNNREMRYPKPYDTHQNCNKCGKTRFYRFDGGEVFAGPLFKRLIDSETARKGY